MDLIWFVEGEFSSPTEGTGTQFISIANNSKKFASRFLTSQVDKYSEKIGQFNLILQECQNDMKATENIEWCKLMPL